MASWFAVLGGLVPALSPVAAVAALPIAVWEFSLGVYLTFWGFKVPPVALGRGAESLSITSQRSTAALRDA